MLKDKELFKGRFINVISRNNKYSNREIILMNDAVACIVYNKEKDKILLVKQDRFAIKGESKTSWEIPAGMLDVEGEGNEECLARELKEETGLDIDGFEFLCNPYSLIGCCTHQIAIYKAVTEEKTVGFYDSDVTEARWFTIDEVQ
ncbi:MAG: NUDIX hydrolase, partial [Bacteroidales bacterium]|nr:NUDIX hydrolase [Bacteroidales bacterium]